MHYILSGVIAVVLVVATLVFIRKLLKPNEDQEAQIALDRYLSELSTQGIGIFYERYIGYLYEVEGYDVEYHGAIKGFADLGRDLIVRNSDEAFIIQTKCWAKFKSIQEKHVFQLFGSMMHFKLTDGKNYRTVKAVLYTTAKFSDVTRDIAKVLGIALRNEELVKSYPMIKCNVSLAGEKTYYLPFDPSYDKIKIRERNGEFFAHKVEEAVAKGFCRAENFKKVA